MDLKNNPFLTPADPLEPLQHQKSQYDKELEEFQRAHYEVFIVNKDGKHLFDLYEKRVIIPSHIDPGHPQAQQLAMWWDGFKACARGLKGYALVHAHRINQGGLR